MQNVLSLELLQEKKCVSLLIHTWAFKYAQMNVHDKHTYIGCFPICKRSMLFYKSDSKPCYAKGIASFLCHVRVVRMLNLAIFCFGYLDF